MAFRLTGNMIKVTRGDDLPLTLSIPYSDDNDYIRYTDGTIGYWYDQTEDKLYDNDYNEVKDVSVKDLEMDFYTFMVGDKIKFGVYTKNGFNKFALLLKEFVVEEETTELDISLTGEETEIGELINKPTDYWYEIELNETTTVLGYDDDKAKIFRLYPEGSEIEE